MGVDGTYTVGRYLASGERRPVHFAERPCRLNSYRDSFTQSQQVSDGETWQEVLAAHLGEPIRSRIRLSACARRVQRPSF